MNPIPLRRHLYFWVFVCAATFLDLYSKEVVFDQLGGPGNRGAWNMKFFNGGVFFEFLTTLNHGALWGMGQGFSLIFAALSLLAVGVILFWLFVKRHAHSLWLTTCLAMIMAGTLGNLYDRLGLHGIKNQAGELQHAVRDFLHFNLWGFEWAIFNFADVFLIAGAIMLAGHSLFVAEVDPTPANEAEKNSTEVRSVA